MAIEDGGQTGNPAEQPGAGDPSGAPASSTSTSQGTDVQADDQKSEEQGGGRMSQAKAFYRAMFAGEDKAPEDFGMNLAPQKEPSREPDRELTARCSFLENQVSELEKKSSETENLYKRMAADFENYKRRIDREREEFQALGGQKALEAILPALDDLDRAKSSLNAQQDPASLLQSLNIVFTKFSKCMENVGLKAIECMGEPFDPRLHEPVQEIETTEFPDGVVMQELRRGYMLKDKVVRPSLVNVSSNPTGVVTGAQQAAALSQQVGSPPPAAQPAAQSAAEQRVSRQGIPAARGAATHTLPIQDTQTTDLPVIDQSEVLRAASAQEQARNQAAHAGQQQPVYDISDADEEVAK